MAKVQVYENGWSGWEDGAGIVIYQDGDQLYQHQTGSSCDGGSWDFEEPISWEAALALIDEWESDLPSEGEYYELGSHFNNKGATMSKGNKPDYNLSGLNKGTDVKGKIGVGWDKPDGSISIKLNPFVVLDGSNPDLVLTLFPYKEGFEHRSDKAAESRKAPPVFGGDDMGETLVQDEIPF